MTAPQPARTYLTETSALLAALGDSTQDHCRHYEEKVAGGVRKSSVYVRKEFIAAFVCELIDIAIEISLSRSVKDAFVQLSQRFGTRPHKTSVIYLGQLLESESVMDNPVAAVEEVGRLAVKTLKTFDRTFESLVPNATGCQIGSNRLRVDYNRLLDDLKKFLLDFREDVKDCSINALVGIGQPTQRARVLIEGDKTGKLDSVKNLAKLIEANSAFSCKSCRKIGDAAIALEQPADVCLVHLDKSFLQLCPALEREHLHILSVSAVTKMERAKQPQTSRTGTPPEG